MVRPSIQHQRTDTNLTNPTQVKPFHKPNYQHQHQHPTSAIAPPNITVATVASPCLARWVGLHRTARTLGTAMATRTARPRLRLPRLHPPRSSPSSDVGRDPGGFVDLQPDKQQTKQHQTTSIHKQHQATKL